MSLAQVSDSPRTFQDLSSTQAYVLGSDGNLWLEQAPFGKIPPDQRSQVDGSVQTFQALSDSEAYVLGRDGNLWLEYAPWAPIGQVPPRRDPVDGNVKAFVAMSDMEAFVLGTDGNLWHEHAYFGQWGPNVPPPREHVDGNVAAFQPLSSDEVLVLGTDGKLWLEYAPFKDPVPPRRDPVDANVAAFQGLSDYEVLVLGTNGNLWLEHAPFKNPVPPQREQVDGRVAAFQGMSDTVVFVLGSDGKLWEELAPFGNQVPPQRSQVDGNVQAFQPLSDSEALVLGINGNLWLEHSPFGNVVPPRREQVDGHVALADSQCDRLGCISQARLSANISNALQNKVVGYVSIVGDQLPVAGGLARTPADPPETAMSPNLVTDIASVSKTLTTIGVLQSLAKHGLTINSLIWPYIYSDWTKGPNINTITFKDLLTHKAGIRADCDGDKTTYADLKALIANGVNLADKNVASYNNCNFAIFRELLPVMEGNSLTYLGDNARANASANLYINYMNQNVFRPLGIPSNGATRVTCTPPQWGRPDILSYPFPAWTTAGTDWGDWKLSCGGGGWVLSADDLFRVINDLANGNVLLTGAEKSEMFTNCLGWDCSVRNDCPDPYVCKNGGLHNGPISIFTYAGIFKCNVPVTVFVNSPLPSPYQNGSDIIGLVKDAYNNAVTVSFPGSGSGGPGQMCSLR